MATFPLGLFLFRVANMLRAFLEAFLRSHWAGNGVRLRYWDGHEIHIGTPPHDTTITIHMPSVLWGMAINPALEFGRAYVDGRVTVDGDLQQFLRDTSSLGATGRTASWTRFVNGLLAQLQARSRRSRAEANARFHYDTGNEFFKLWLDPSMTYSCAYFRTEQDSLETAQTQKRELICRKLDLQAGQTMLDVGCGWGALLFHAIENYGVRGTGITASREQAAYVQKEAERRKIADRLTLHVGDYERVGGAFDRVASVGMYEQVGKEHGRAFFQKWRSWMKPDGISLLHTIGGLEELPPDPWIDEYIFPGGYIPALHELATHAAAAGLIVMDMENLWRHYALTLAAWCRNFDAARPHIVQMNGERFARIWWLYLNAAQAAFATGRLLLWQFVLTPGKQPAQLLTRERWVLPPH